MRIFSILFACLLCFNFSSRASDKSVTFSPISDLQEDLTEGDEYIFAVNQNGQWLAMSTQSGNQFLSTEVYPDDEGNITITTQPVSILTARSKKKLNSTKYQLSWQIGDQYLLATTTNTNLVLSNTETFCQIYYLAGTNSNNILRIEYMTNSAGTMRQILCNSDGNFGHFAQSNVNGNGTAYSVPVIFKKTSSYSGPVELNLGFAQDVYEVTLGDGFDAPQLTGNDADALIVYSSSNEAVATVDTESGEVTIHKYGITTITAAVPEDNPDFFGSASYTLRVLPTADMFKDVYTISEFLDVFEFIPDGQEVTIVGFITGYENNGKPEFSLNGAYDTNFVISESLDNNEPFAAIDIPIGNTALRNELGLVKKPENLGRKIKVVAKKKTFDGLPGAELISYSWEDLQPAVSLRNHTLAINEYNALFRIPEDVTNYTITVSSLDIDDAPQYFETDDWRYVTPSCLGYYQLEVAVPVQGRYTAAFNRQYEVRVVDPEAADLNVYTLVTSDEDFASLYAGDITEQNFVIAFGNANTMVAMGSQNDNNFRNDALVNIEGNTIIPGTDVAIVRIRKEADGMYSLYSLNNTEGYLSPGRTYADYSWEQTKGRGNNNIYTYNDYKEGDAVPTAAISVADGKAEISFPVNFEETGKIERLLRHNTGTNGRFATYASNTSAAKVSLYAQSTKVTMEWKFIGDDGQAVAVTDKNVSHPYRPEGYKYALQVTPAEAASYFTLEVEGSTALGIPVADGDYSLDTEGEKTEATVITAGEYSLNPVFDAGGTHFALVVTDNILDVEVLPLTLSATTGESDIIMEWSSEGFTEEYDKAFTFKLDEQLSSGINEGDLAIVAEPLFTPEYGPKPEGEPVDDLYYDFAPSYDIDFVPSYNMDKGHADIKGIVFPVSGLYAIRLVSNSPNVVIAADVRAINFEVYPSLTGLTLAYESALEDGGTKQFRMDPTSDGLVIKNYVFELWENTQDWYHEGSKNPRASINAAGVEMWYKLHGLENVTDLTGTQQQKLRGADTLAADGYTPLSEDGTLYIGKYAYAKAEDGNPDLSFVLVKNGASTPYLANTEENPKSVQYVTLSKVDATITGVASPEVDETEAVYYDLQGVRVPNPQKGVYIRVAGGKAEKVVL